MNSLFFELIRVGLGLQKELSFIPNEKEWDKLFELSMNHTIAGICSNGVQILFKDPKYANTFSRRVLLKWVGIENIIKEENRKVNKRCVKLINFFSEQGLSCSILKGQGLASIYKNDYLDLSLLRQSGDIDLWIGGGRKVVWSHIHKLFGSCEFDYKTIHPTFYSDTEVEIHWFPEILMNLIRNRRLQKYWRNNEKKLYSDKIELPEGVGCFQIPSVSMNRFYILLHCYRHTFDSGLGLRQVMDYYFVLRQDKEKTSRLETMRLVKDFGMSKFAAAMMWIMQEIFHLEKDYLLCSPDKEEGRFLLNEIMQSGNFGHHDKRVRAIGNSMRVRYLSRILQRMPHLIMHYPKEMLWAPIWLLYHYFWKRIIR